MEKHAYINPAIENISTEQDKNKFILQVLPWKERIQSPEKENIERTSKPRLTFYAAWSAIFATFAGLYQYGFAIGTANTLHVPLTKAITEQYRFRYGMDISNSTVEAIWTVSSAAFPVGGVVGLMLVGPVVSRFGRLRGMILGHFITVLMSLLAGLSKVMSSPEALIIARMGIGITSATVGLGIGSLIKQWVQLLPGISPIYIVEVTPKHLRGLFGSTIALMITFGLLMANVFGLPQLLGNESHWDLCLALAGAPSLIYLLLSRTFAPSPRKLFIEDGNKNEATLLLQRLRGVEDVSQEINELAAEKMQAESAKQLTVWELITSKKLRKGVIYALVVGSAYQITGINGVFFNLNKIYSAAGVSSHLIYIVTIGVTVLGMVFQSLTAQFSEKYGRKSLLLIGYIIEGISLVILVVAMETQQYSNVMAYVSVAASLGFWIGFSIGPGTLSVLLVAESFDQISRSAAVMLCTFAAWLSFTVTVTITSYMLNSLGGYTFLPYGMIAFFAAAYIRKYVPETKGRSFIEVQRAICAKKIKITTIQA